MWTIPDLCLAARLKIRLLALDMTAPGRHYHPDPQTEGGERERQILSGDARREPSKYARSAQRRVGPMSTIHSHVAAKQLGSRERCQSRDEGNEGMAEC
jgi:hypothetical protein